MNCRRIPKYPPRPLASKRVDLEPVSSWTPPASWILSRWLPDLLLLYSKNRKPSSPTPLPALGSLGRKSSPHLRRRQITPGKSIQPRLLSASLPHRRKAKHHYGTAIFWAPPATTEDTKPPPITTRILRFPNTGNQESDATMNSKTPLVSGPAGDHRVHQTVTKHHYNHEGHSGTEYQRASAGSAKRKQSAQGLAPAQACKIP